MSLIIETPTAAHASGAPGNGPGSAPTPAPVLKVVRRRRIGRWVISGLLTFLAAQFLFSLATNPRYKWNVFAEYFFAPAVLAGLGLALVLTALGTVLGFALGTVIALLRLSPSPLLSGPAWAFVWFFRSVPLVVLILVFYNLGYLYPTLGLGTPFTTDFWLVEFQTTMTITAFAAALIGISLHEAAYASEIIRAGILSVDAGQLEASAALGLPAHVRFFKIVLPQAARTILPNAFNLIIGLVKGTSVTFIVALPEIFYTVQVIYNRNGRVIPLLLVACVWYAIITTLLSLAQHAVERRFARGTQRTTPPTPLEKLGAGLKAWWARLGAEAVPDVGKRALASVAPAAAPPEKASKPTRVPGAGRLAALDISARAAGVTH